jgi:serine/threonine protein kinase
METYSKDDTSVIALRLMERRQEWASEFLLRAEGKRIGSFLVETLIGFGAEKVAFLSKDTDGINHALKMPWHPTSRCTAVHEMVHSCQQVEQEAWILQRFTIAAFPKFKAIIYNDPIMPTAAGVGKVPYLAEELIPGQSLEDILLRYDAGGRGFRMNEIATACLDMIVRMGAHLSQMGWLYTDYGPANFVIKDRSIRIVDPGSISIKVNGKVRRPRITLRSLTPQLLSSFMADQENFYLSEADTLLMLGRTICVILSNQPLGTGQEIDWRLLVHRSDDMIFVLAKRLLRGEFRTFDEVLPEVQKIRAPKIRCLSKG